ncbi:MAG TPA: hypothetical protein VK892_19110 [Pyrinomonadaceae bacterium]|nr:hypothetical protein [Pyrinomonadaceae bacterium]
MKINFKLSFRHIWLAIGIISLILLTYLHFGTDPQNAVQKTLLVLNVLMFILSLPCSLFALPVVISAAYFLDMQPNSVDGIYLNTILLFVLGAMQWFWIARFWSPTEPPLQRLDLLGEKSK